MIFNNSININYINNTSDNNNTNEELNMLGYFILILVSIVICYCICTSKHKQIDCIEDVINDICNSKR